MIVLSGAGLILPDRTLSPGTIAIDGDRIVDVRAGEQAGATRDLRGHYIAPGFIDVHVHGVEGIDALDPPSRLSPSGAAGAASAIESIAARLPRYGVTAFCPTTVACTPDALRRVLDQVRRARAAAPRGARVLPAHLESNFINPDYKGAQPAACLRSPRAALDASAGAPVPSGAGGFDGSEILSEIARAPGDVGIVTLAPELPGGVDLVRWLVARGHRVSLGHSGASFDQGMEAIAAGARHATHLFNRMPPVEHRAPGLVGAILQSEAVAAELICDGVHVHPSMLRTAIAAKKPSRILAITDATGGAGLPAGARASLGGRPITVRDNAAFLDDGTLAGSVLTMDRAFRLLVETVGLSLVDAATVCASTAARELQLEGHGVLSVGAVADLVVLDQRFSVVQTYVAGELVYSRTP